MKKALWPVASPGLAWFLAILHERCQNLALVYFYDFILIKTSFYMKDSDLNVRFFRKDKAAFFAKNAVFVISATKMLFLETCAGQEQGAGAMKTARGRVDARTRTAQRLRLF